MKHAPWLILAAIVASATPALALEPLLMHCSGLGFMHPIQEPECFHYPCWCLDQPCCCCKDHIYIFGVNGFNPLCTGNFNGLCRYLRDQGFENTYFGQLFSSHVFCRRIRNIVDEDPDAKIVLIGFSLGCNYVRCMANLLGRQGIQVDLLVYLAGDTIFNTARSCPENVCRVLNINAHGLVLTGGDLTLKGAELDCARNCFVDTRHILVPSRHETVELIMEELLALACVPCCANNGNGAEPLPPPGNLPAKNVP